tara:strand:- start:2798 stop:3916 length:1119 start_codon:yes stop_codon:yes gene_type:complete
MKKRINCGIFISDEGFGHMVRQRAIIKELINKYPSIIITVFTSKNIFYLKETFENRINYLNIPMHLKTVKNLDGSLNIYKTKKIFKSWEKNIKLWKNKVSIYFKNFDFIISDCVPEAFDLSKKFNVLSFGVSHFTWDWFFENVCKINPLELNKIQNSFNKCDHFLFPPFTPEKILKKYRKKIHNVNFIVGDFKKKVKKKQFQKCLIMDNGTRSLSRLINKTVPYLKKIKNIEFYVCIDHLDEKNKNEIFASKNIVPVSGLKKMHEKVEESDFIIARGGFNTISECLVLKKPALFFNEKNNPEVSENLRLVYKKQRLACLINENEWGKNFQKKLNSFILKDAIKIYDKLKYKNFKYNGAYQVVNIISKKIKNL